MTANIRILAIICAILFSLIFINLIKKRSIKPFYSFLWLMISLVMFAIIIFEKAFKAVATLIGIRDASFLVIIGVILFLMVYVLHLSLKISELSDRVQELISYVAILDKHEPAKKEPGQGDVS